MADEPITDDELLNLARRIWGDQATYAYELEGVAEVLDTNERLLLYVAHPRPREALHAVLTALINLDQQEKS